jgi:hypothetical protein
MTDPSLAGRQLKYPRAGKRCMSEDNPHERDVTLAKEKEEEDDENEEAEQAREEAAEGEVETESEKRETAAREAENPDNHRDESPHSS